jgi:vacuolar protein sorting-associated protein 53
MTSLLSKVGSSLTVKLLLDTLQVTTEFEASMAKKWATPVSILCNHVNKCYSSVSFVLQFQEILNTTSSTSSRPPQSISTAFEPHMSVFVDAQDK